MFNERDTVVEPHTLLKSKSRGSSGKLNSLFMCFGVEEKMGGEKRKKRRNFGLLGEDETEAGRIHLRLLC